jgi:ketosteroid isomerase-like protein
MEPAAELAKGGSVAQVTPELVGKAYAALASGDMAQIEQYWAEDMIWLVPGHNPLSGLYHGRDAFLGFMAEVGRQSASSFNMESVAVMASGEYSADVTHNVGYRAGFEGKGNVPYTKLDINVVHVLRWRDGKVIEGRGAIFGDGTTEYDLFWAPTTKDERL